MDNLSQIDIEESRETLESIINTINILRSII